MEEAAHLDSGVRKNTFEVRGQPLSTQLLFCFLEDPTEIGTVR
jgi:hypothetical protein